MPRFELRLRCTPIYNLNSNISIRPNKSNSIVTYMYIYQTCQCTRQLLCEELDQIRKSLRTCSKNWITNIAFTHQSYSFDFFIQLANCLFCLPQILHIVSMLQNTFAMNSQGCISPTHLTIFSSFYSRSKPHQSLRIASNWLTVFIVLYICKMCLSKKNNLFQPSDFCLSMDLSVRCCIRKQRTEMWDRKFKIDTDMKWTSFSIVSLYSELQWQRVQWHNSGWLQSLQQGLISRT